MSGPLFVTVAVVLGFGVIFPSIDVTHAGIDFHADHLIALFMGGMAGGMRFLFLRGWTMEMAEKVVHITLSYLIATLVPLTILAGLLAVAKDAPQVAALVLDDVPTSDLLGFLAAYVGVDIVPSLAALYVGVTFPQFLTPRRRYKLRFGGKAP
ncbi:MAG: hypothetical protein AAFP13_14675 [Pseudomonadota bacterium]